MVLGDRVQELLDFLKTNPPVDNTLLSQARLSCNF